MNFKKILLFILILSVVFYLFSLLLNNSYSYLDPDLGWHFKVGEDILKKGDAPRLNHYNFTLLNESWIDHEWLMEVLMYSIYDFSYLSLHLFFVVVALLAFFIAIIPTLKEYKYRPAVFFAAALPLIFSIYISTPHLGLRPQEFALLFTSILLLIIYNYEKKANLKYLFILPILFFVWANLHGSFILGLGLLFAWFFIKVIFFNKYFYKLFNKLKLQAGRQLETKERKIFSLFLVITIIFTLLNPYGFDLYLSLFEYSNTYYLSNIAEWLSQFSYPFKYNQLLYLTISLAMVLIFIFFEPVKKRGKLNIWSLFLYFFFLILAFKSRRHFPLFVIVNLGFFTQILLFYGQEFKKLKPPKFLFIINSFIVIIITILLSFNYFKTINWHQDPFNNFCYNYPCEAVSFMKSSDDLKDLNLYNHYGWGGYMIWMYPEKLLFIDGRMPHYPYNDISILEEYNKFKSEDEKQIEKMIDKHEIELFLLKSHFREIEFKAWENFLFGFNDENIIYRNNLIDYLNQSTSFKNIYEDKTAIIFKKIN